ncbi:MAG: heat-inducible transcription repressor HrcA [Cytophagales bacterium]|nr:heat-inducible transcription repressor HrcA [Armatimonadota bacterium]
MELDARKQRILQAIVEDYVATAEPVGSQVLVQRYSLGVKSATVRNEMAEMSERGYLRQPHTSAGRVPSDRGYRFYVNRLMALPVIQEGEAARMRQAVSSASSELDTILRKTCQLLTAMTRLPALATPPSLGDTELRQVFVSPAGAAKTLLVLLFSTGHTESRVIADLALSASEALLLANAMNAHFVGSALSLLRGIVPSAETVPGELWRLSDAWIRLCQEAVQAARAAGEDADEMVIEGTHAALEHPEFRDVDRLSQFLTLLQERAALLEMLERALVTTVPAHSAARSVSAVQMTIGAESGLPGMMDYAVVSSPYYVGAREAGTIGVFGPTRMDYARSAAAVDLMARTVGEILTQLRVAP